VEAKGNRELHLRPRGALILCRAEAAGATPGPLFADPERERRRSAMDKCIHDLVPPIALRNHDDPWWRDVKASDEFLDRLFAQYFQELNLPNLMRKADYHILARLVPREMIDTE